MVLKVNMVVFPVGMAVSDRSGRVLCGCLWQGKKPTHCAHRGTAGV